MSIAWIVAFLVHSTVLLGLAWIVSRRLPKRPRACASLWRAALVAPLVTATLQVWMQPDTAWRWNVVDPPVARVEPGLAPALDELAWSIATPEIVDTLDVEVAALDDEPSPPVAAAVLEAPPSTAPPSDSPWTWAELLGALWLLGAALGLAAIVLGALRLRAQLHGRRPFVASWGPHELGAPSRVELCIAPRLRVPLVYGVWRPEVCVPTRALLELDDDALRAIVAHELGHVVHRDPLWRWIGLVLERVFFFQPLLRLANRELTACSELLADAWAVGRTQRPLALAESLTVVAAWVRPRALPSAAPAMAGPRSQLRRRVERLVDANAAGVVDPRPRWLAPTVGVVVAGLVAFAPGVTAQAMCPTVASGFGFDPSAYAAWVTEAGGPTVIVLQGDVLDENDEAPATVADEGDKKSARKAAKQRRKDRRQAEKRVKQAFKRARKRGEMPTEDELVAALHGGKRKGTGDGVVVVIRDGNGRSVVRIDSRALERHGEHARRQLAEAERHLRHEQRRLEQRARVIERLLEAEREGRSIDDEYLRYFVHPKHKHKNKHKADKHKRKHGEHPGRGHGWGVIAPPAAPHPPGPPHRVRAPAPTPPPARAPRAPRAPSAPPAIAPPAPTAPTPPGLVPVVFE